MRLSIYSIQSTLFEGEVKSVTLLTPMGEITVLDNHLPIITLVKQGNISYIDSRNEEGLLQFPGGVLEVRPGSEAILLSGEEKV